MPTAVAFAGLTSTMMATAISGTRTSTVRSDLSSSPGRVPIYHKSSFRVSNPLENMKAIVPAIEPVWIKDRMRLSVTITARCPIRPGCFYVCRSYP
ncbi:MAG: hypothetical protein A4E28_01020 [Methanocella sp. PtaU1.Bin125]|nr:MAG: hypothetical protein A4E28_01020 [Methanocella sp. PtaU1.Bin125]